MSDGKIVVVGAGNAGLCAALAAREQGASVTILECAPEEERGGNSRFTAGAIRVAYEGVNELKKLMPDLSAEEVANTDFTPRSRRPPLQGTCFKASSDAWADARRVGISLDA